MLFAGENELASQDFEAAQPESEFAAQLTQPDSAESQPAEHDNSAAPTQQLAAYHSTVSQLDESSEGAAELDEADLPEMAADEEAEPGEDDFADEFE